MKGKLEKIGLKIKDEKTKLFDKNYKEIMNITINNGVATTESKNKNYRKMVKNIN